VCLLNVARQSYRNRCYDKCRSKLSISSYAGSGLFVVIGSPAYKAWSTSEVGFGHGPLGVLRILDINVLLSHPVMVCSSFQSFLLDRDVCRDEPTVGLRSLGFCWSWVVLLQL